VKLSLLYSADAGDGVSVAHLRGVFEKAGHQLVHIFENEKDFEHVLEDQLDLVVAAGGDGTVWRVVKSVLGQSIPFAVLPLGTANNIASCLGVVGSVDEVVEGWSGSRLRPFDLGVARGEWGTSRFIEGIGSGLITSGILSMDRDPPHDETTEADSKLALAVRRYRDVLSRLKPRRWKLSVDGEPLDDEYLLLEVLNICSVGANMVLAPAADPSDGMFDVVTATEDHRDEILAYLDRRIAGEEAALSLPVRRARRIQISGWDQMHVDDVVVAGDPIGTVDVHCEAGALEILGR